MKSKEEKKLAVKLRVQRWNTLHADLIRERKQALKVEVLSHYGGGKCICVKCGFSDIRALSIDHIEGGGNRHTKRILKKSGSSFYSWLKKEGYPEGYQTLCMNCQFIKRMEQDEYYHHNDNPSRVMARQRIVSQLVNHK